MHTHVYCMLHSMLYLENTLSAYLCSRDGPTAWDVTGLLQPIADGTKLLAKSTLYTDSWMLHHML